MTLAEQIELACVIEATARKPGNVHPDASFDDLHYEDFVAAAAVSAPILARTVELGVGRAVYETVDATQSATGTNVNLGMCLLLAPLSCGAAAHDLWNGARRALAQSTVAETEWIYRAIRRAQPGGMGKANEQDLGAVPTLTIPAVMALAADRDDVARELSTGFERLERKIVPSLREQLHRFNAPPLAVTAKELSAGQTLHPEWERAILVTHLQLISEGDTLIGRKCGESTCRDAAVRAAALLRHFEVMDGIKSSAVAEFDEWLRGDGNRRNPGTSADLIAAALFAVLGDRDCWIPKPGDSVNALS